MHSDHLRRSAVLRTEGDGHDPQDTSARLAFAAAAAFPARRVVELEPTELERERLFVRAIWSAYPAEWPPCPWCGLPALEGEITCGDAHCSPRNLRAGAGR